MTSSSSSSKKYKLFSASALADPSIKPICAFFGTSKGCRLGDQCQFRHEAPGASGGAQQQQQQQQHQQPRLVSSVPVNNNNNNNNKNSALANTAPISDSSSVVSSESEGEIRETRAAVNPFVTPSYASLSNNRSTALMLPWLSRKYSTHCKAVRASSTESCTVGMSCFKKVVANSLRLALAVVESCTGNKNDESATQ